MKYGLEKVGKANVTLKQKQEGILNVIALKQKDVTSSEYFTRTSLYLVRLKYFNGLNFIEDIYIKFRENELAEIS